MGIKLCCANLSLFTKNGDEELNNLEIYLSINHEIFLLPFV
jgi:hypothetical protein